MDKKFHEMLAGYVDGELPEEQRRAFEAELQKNSDLRAELDEFRKLKEVTGMVQYADLPDEVWATYWESLYRKTERGLGWIFLSIGAIVLLAFGLATAFWSMFHDPDVPLWFKIGASAAALGIIILLVSFTRERLFAYKRDRYKEVQR